MGRRDRERNHPDVCRVFPPVPTGRRSAARNLEMFMGNLPNMWRAAAFAFAVVTGMPAQAATLTADAGATPEVVNGQVVLLGSGWGGHAPYRFEWSLGDAEIINRQQFAARVDVSDWEAGHYEAVLTVTDRSGNRASDSVRFVIGETRREPLSVSAGGIYQFIDGAPQELRAQVNGGTPPYAVAWDFDRDGGIDAQGEVVRAKLPAGHHLVRALVTDAEGLESQQMTSVYVGKAQEMRDMVVPLTIIGMSDSGINPYHSEFSAATYPDPRVLELTENFTRPPCEYIANFPCRSQPIPITLNGEYYPEQDKALWHTPVAGQFGFVQPGVQYWIPGTKIIGAYSNGGYDDAPADLIVDNNGHGSGSAGVAVGNRYGYCPTCLIFIVDGLDDDDVYGFPYAEITTHSHGYVGNAPLGVTALNDPLDLLIDPASKQAVERGVNVLFSAGNGVGNAFIVTNETYGSDQNGPAWTVLVGALRRDTSGAIVGEGTPAHVSSWGDGWLPSACRTGVDNICPHSGTSAASPYTAGVFGSVLRGVRQALGDPRTGVRPGQVIAEGLPIPGSPWLADGKLTRRELRGVVLKTAASLDARTSMWPYPVNTNASDRFLFEGYGAATPNAAARALEVLLGRAELPDRSDADQFFAVDCELRDALYGSYDRNGDGNEDSCAEDIASLAEFQGTAPVSNLAPYRAYAAAADEVPQTVALSGPLYYELHRTLAHEPYRDAAACGLPRTANEEDHQQFMSQRPGIEGDLEPCFDSRITGTIGGFRPKGVFAADDELTGLLPAGSQVDVTVYVQPVTAGPVQLQAFLNAGDRVIGSSEAVVQMTAPLSWTAFEFSFSTDRIAVAGERLGLHFTLSGQVEWAYGFEGDHASSLTITPADVDAPAPFGVVLDSVTADADGVLVSGRASVPDLGEDTELGQAGFSPANVVVQLAASTDFSDAVWAAVDPRTGTFTARLADASATGVSARVWRNRTVSPVSRAELSASRVAPVVPDSRGGSNGLLVLLLLLGLGLVRRRPAC